MTHSCKTLSQLLNRLIQQIASYRNFTRSKATWTDCSGFNTNLWHIVDYQSIVYSNVIKMRTESKFCYLVLNLEHSFQSFGTVYLIIFQGKDFVSVKKKKRISHYDNELPHYPDMIFTYSLLDFIMQSGSFLTQFYDQSII